MATTCFFEETITDKKDKSIKVELEFGRSSYYGESLLYLRFGDTGLIVDEKTGRKIAEQMAAVAAYLGYDK